MLSDFGQVCKYRELIIPVAGDGDVDVHVPPESLRVQHLYRWNCQKVISLFSESKEHLPKAKILLSLMQKTGSEESLTNSKEMAAAA